MKVGPLPRVSFHRTPTSINQVFYKSTLSTATRCPSDFKSVPVALVGHALCRVHTIFGANHAQPLTITRRLKASAADYPQHSAIL
jgi:hypothetical protein